MLIAILIVILSLAVAVYFSENLPKQYHKYFFWYCVAVFVIMSMFRPGSYVSDYIHYEKYFYSFDEKRIQLIVEPTFLWISEFIYNRGGTLRNVIYIYALISIPLKLYSIRKLTDETVFLLTMMVYAGHFYMLHDCEQIRLAAGMAFGMYAMYLRVERKHFALVAVTLLMGVSFHHTIAALAIPLLIAPKELTKWWKIALATAIPIGIIFWVLKINPITMIPIPYLEKRMLMYEIAISNGHHPDVRVINIMVILRVLLVYYILYYYDNIKEHLKGLPILLVCNVLSIVAWFGLWKMSVVAVRMSQLYGFIEIILFASVYYTIKPKWVGKTFVIFIALYLFLQNYIYNQFGFR